MAVDLSPGFYREECGEAAVLYVDDARDLWLIFTGDDAELPMRLADELAVGIGPHPGIRPDLAAEYRGMVERAKGRGSPGTWRQRPPLL